MYNVQCIIYNYLKKLQKIIKQNFEISFIFKLSLIVFFVSIFFYSNVFAKYNRIVSLAPSVTESLYELGIDKEIVGITIYCSKGTFKKEIIGTVTEPNVEKIVSLKPDLVISTKEGNYQSIVDRLVRLNLNVYTVDPYLSFEEICNNFQNLAKFLDKENIAQQIIKDVNKELLQIKITENNLNVFWEVGANPLFSVGNKSFINDYCTFLNIKNIFDDINARYPNINIESVIKKNPDIIFLVNMGDVSDKEIHKWNKYKNINAVKNKRIVVVGADDIFVPTPKGFLKGLKILQSKI